MKRLTQNICDAYVGKFARGAKVDRSRTKTAKKPTFCVDLDDHSASVVLTVRSRQYDMLQAYLVSLLLGGLAARLRQVRTSVLKKRLGREMCVGIIRLKRFVVSREFENTRKTARPLRVDDTEGR